MALPRCLQCVRTMGRTAPYLQGAQRRWAQVHDVRFLVTHMSSERVVDRYKDKLQRKAQEEGYDDVAQLKAVYKEKTQPKRKPKPEVSPFIDHPEASDAQAKDPAEPPPERSQNKDHLTAESSTSSSIPGVRTLSSYIDITKATTLPQHQLEHIWRLRHSADPQSLSAVIPDSTYSRIEATARRHPQFILPIPREGKGAEIHFLQWNFPTQDICTIMFTHLGEYKLRGEYAQPHTTVTHHLDLRKSNGLVLLQGSVVSNRGVSTDEAKWLLMCLQKFYGSEPQPQNRRRQLLEHFSQGNPEFKVEELLEEAEKII